MRHCAGAFPFQLWKRWTLSGTWVLALDLCFPAFAQEQASTLMELPKVTLTARTKIWVFLCRGAPY